MTFGDYDEEAREREKIEEEDDDECGELVTNLDGRVGVREQKLSVRLRLTGGYCLHHLSLSGISTMPAAGQMGTQLTRFRGTEN